MRDQENNKIGKLMMCKRYTEMYNGVTDTISSNIFYVEKVLNLNEEKRINSEILIELTDKIKNKKIIDYSKLKETKISYGQCAALHT